MTLAEFIGVLLTTVMGIIVVALIYCFPIMLMWNAWIVPAITVLMPITWMQAFGIIVVSKMLFGVSRVKTKSAA